MKAWVAEVLLAPARTRPIVALTTHPATGRFLIDPATVEARLGSWADVVGLETGAATWELADALPDRMDVYGGAMRVWWPGLTRESDPLDHRLYMVRSEEDGLRRLADLESQVRRRVGAAVALQTPARAPRRVPEAFDPRSVTVTSAADGLIVKDADGVTGRVEDSDIPLDAVAVCLRDGQKLRVSWPRGWRAEDGEAPCSLRGMLPSPWDLIAGALRVGSVVQARVVAIKDKYAIVHVLPDAKGIVGVSDVDHTFVTDIHDFITVDELVAVHVKDVDAVSRKLQLSIKAALLAGAPPQPLPSLVPGGLPFSWPAYLERAGIAYREKRDARDERIDELEREIEAAHQDRAELRRSLGERDKRIRRLEEQLAAGEDAGGAGGFDPLADERAFLRAVRVAYAHALDEGDRVEKPLRAMRVGPRFLATARDLQGVSVDKIVEVAAQVACDQARENAGREVHPLHEGAGSRQRVRARDGAKAWRCAIQIKTPSARRLHWWLIPGPNGGTIEFASVGVHDDYDIPES